MIEKPNKRAMTSEDMMHNTDRNTIASEKSGASDDLRDMRPVPKGYIRDD